MAVFQPAVGIGNRQTGQILHYLRAEWRGREIAPQTSPRYRLRLPRPKVPRLWFTAVPQFVQLRLAPENVRLPAAYAPNAAGWAGCAKRNISIHDFLPDPYDWPFNGRL